MQSSLYSKTSSAGRTYNPVGFYTDDWFVMDIRWSNERIYNEALLLQRETIVYDAARWHTMYCC